MVSAACAVLKVEISSHIYSKLDGNHDTIFSSLGCSTEFTFCSISVLEKLLAAYLIQEYSLDHRLYFFFLSGVAFSLKVILVLIVI